MKVFTVRYKTWSSNSDLKSVEVVARSVVQAATFVGRKKYVGYSGYIVSVVENLSAVVVAK